MTLAEFFCENSGEEITAFFYQGREESEVDKTCVRENELNQGSPLETKFVVDIICTHK